VKLNGSIIVSLLFLLAAGCAATGKHPEPKQEKAVVKKSSISLDDATKRAKERLAKLTQRKKEKKAEKSAPKSNLLIQRYEEALSLPGTPEAKKPEILLKLAELAYRDEENALKDSYEKDDGSVIPAGFKYPKAIAYHRRLTEEYPDSPQALSSFYNLGYLYAEEGKFDLSADAYQEVLRRDRNTPYASEIHLRLGEAAFDEGDMESAIYHYEIVSEAAKAEYSDKALFKLGWSYFNLQKYRQAADTFARLLEEAKSSQESLKRETTEIMAKSIFEWGGLERLESYRLRNPNTYPYADKLYSLIGGMYFESSQYSDAVKAYSAGVEAYPASPLCLDMEGGILSSYRILRDQEAMHKRREKWPSLYGAGTEWDKAAKQEELSAARDKMLEEGLRLAAIYRHSMAQRGHGGFEKALVDYEQYFKYFGDSTEEGYELSFNHAQALREDGRTAEAAKRFRDVAFNKKFSAHTEDASYKRIELLGQLYKDDRSLLDELATAHEDYVKLNPKSEQAPEILFAEAEILFEAEEFARSRGAFERVASQFSSSEMADLSKERIARCWFRENEYVNAETAAREALKGRLEPEVASETRKLLAFSIFKQGETLEAVDDLEGANKLFFALAEEFPKLESAELALFRAAENLRKMEKNQEAAKVYDRIAKVYKTSEHASNALAISAQLFSSIGDWTEAAANFESLYQNHTDAEDAPNFLFKAAKLYEKAKMPDEAARLFAEFSTTFNKDKRVAEALFREAEALMELNKVDLAKEKYSKTWDCESSEAGDPYRAKAALALGKLRLDDYEKIRLVGDLETALTTKEALLNEALEYLTKAASLPYSETLTEALFRTGGAFEHMKVALLESERPAGLSDEELEEYQFLLEEKAFPLEEQAVNFYRKGADSAIKNNAYNEWVDEIFMRLEKLIPWAYQRTEETAVASAPSRPPWEHASKEEP